MEGGGLMGSAPRAAQQQQAASRMSSSSTGPAMGGQGIADQASHNGGVQAGVPPQYNAVQQAQQGPPDLAAIQAEMQRRQVGAQLNQNPQNSALAGYMMG